MKLQHRLTKQVIDVPQDHAMGVLLPQGRWLEYTAEAQPVITPAEEVLPAKSLPLKKVTKKKTVRPRKTK